MDLTPKKKSQKRCPLSLAQGSVALVKESTTRLAEVGTRPVGSQTSVEVGTGSVGSRTANFTACSFRSASQREASIRIAASPEKPAKKGRTSPTASPSVSPSAVIQLKSRHVFRRKTIRCQRESQYHTWTRLQQYTSFSSHIHDRVPHQSYSHQLYRNIKRVRRGKGGVRPSEYRVYFFFLQHVRTHLHCPHVQMSHFLKYV